jgi:hypothetical protein
VNYSHFSANVSVGETGGKSAEIVFAADFFRVCTRKIDPRLVVFNFQRPDQSTREYVTDIFAVAIFLKYSASEQELVDRVVMNLHPSILAHSAFLERPHSRDQLYKVIDLIEEKISVAKARNNPSPTPTSEKQDVAPPRGQAQLIKCWKCGRYSHVQHNCRQGPASSGNGAAPGGI